MPDGRYNEAPTHNGNGDVTTPSFCLPVIFQTPKIFVPPLFLPSVLFAFQRQWPFTILIAIDV
ncbi:unnamed protein product [Clavelina lepadiformis]|uniref:Uncharacterized protein n=1 Tax=Clavelina lepadiformis TaxID=159417 RepID=A0ABP0EXB9_CLALP